MLKISIKSQLPQKCHLMLYVSLLNMYVSIPLRTAVLELTGMLYKFLFPGDFVSVVNEDEEIPYYSIIRDMCKY